jgi:hypothetical protein
MRVPLVLLAVWCAVGAGAYVILHWPGPGIALDHRIGAVSLNEPMSQAEGALGPGEKRADWRRCPDFFVSHYPRDGIHVAYSCGRDAMAYGVDTRSARYKTDTGVGVGSTLRALQHRIPDVRCYLRDPDPHCEHTSADYYTVTHFYLDKAKNRVVDIAVEWSDTPPSG